MLKEVYIDVQNVIGGLFREGEKCCTLGFAEKQGVIHSAFTTLVKSLVNGGKWADVSAYNDRIVCRYHINKKLSLSEFRTYIKACHSVGIKPVFVNRKPNLVKLSMKLGKKVNSPSENQPVGVK